MNRKITALAFLIFLFSCAESNVKHIEFNGRTMGTTYSIKIITKSKLSEPDKIKSAIDSVLLDVNKKMSTYIDDSELSIFNKSNDTNWMSVSSDLADVISEALQISKQTGGMYDVTIGPLVNLWGFGPAEKRKKIPTEKEINEVKKNTGYQKLSVDVKNHKIKKTNPNIYCDLSSIAKGYGVDKVALLLDDYGIENYMIEIGGEVKTKGQNRNKENWKIGIATPSNNGLQKIVSLSNLSMATSGDYLNYFEKNGVRYSHTINPKTGKPVKHKLASVSVIHSDCSYADAFATAIDVMGPEKGFKFALQQNLPIFMIVREKNSFNEKMTPQFEKFVLKGN